MADPPSIFAGILVDAFEQTGCRFVKPV